MSPRPPAPAPELPGFTFVKLLGSGGFADVYLYQQQRMSRQVAVKVMLPDALGEAQIGQFAAEADVMAQLSTHPAIVTIYESGVSIDGRPYLVMEYCPKPNLQKRFRSERISVAEALRIGVSIAGAVETSHRADILHRDIKPANILVTQYNQPKLTDFGIAAGTGSSDVGGLSVPWSPPESFSSPPRSTRQSDVWALGATVYSLLAGRSPFELPGASNRELDLMGRIESSPLPPTGRPDVPPSLEQALATAMAKRIEQRQPTALDFARALQKVEIELGMSVTRADVLDDGAPEAIEKGEEGGETRIRRITTIDPAVLPVPRTSSATVPAVPIASVPLASAPVIDDRTLRAGVAVPLASAGSSLAALPAVEVEATQLRPSTPAGARVAQPDSGRRSRRPLLIGAGVVVVLAVVGVVAATLFAPKHPAPRHSSAPQEVTQQTAVPAPRSVVGKVDGAAAVFSWSDPDPRPGDSYLWGVVSPGAQPDLAQTTKTTVRVPLQQGQTCVEVLLRRADGHTSEQPVTGCVR